MRSSFLGTRIYIYGKVPQHGFRLSGGKEDTTTGEDMNPRQPLSLLWTKGRVAPLLYIKPRIERNQCGLIVSWVVGTIVRRELFFLNQFKIYWAGIVESR